MSDVKQEVVNGDLILGIELGSTNIKGVLISKSNQFITSSSWGWEGKQIDGIWTYDLADVFTGIQSVYKNIKQNIMEKYDHKLTTLQSIGFSGMMHGYIPFDKDGQQLVRFRTWRNTFTKEAAEALTELFDFVIPERWSIAHLYQAILNKESHVQDVDFMTTLSGYVHWMLTGEKCLGLCEASGMFPIDTKTAEYNDVMVRKFEDLVMLEGLDINLKSILPEPKIAGSGAGFLTKNGAKLIDPEGDLIHNIPMCPPEGDGCTGMIATNSVKPRTGNVSAGTSTFAIIVLEKAIAKRYEEIETLVSPNNFPVAMVHTINCSVEYGDWINLFAEVVQTLGIDIDKGELFTKIVQTADDSDFDCGSLLAYGYHAGEHITGFEAGRPLFTRLSGEGFNLGNFMRAQLYTCICALRTGMDTLYKEGVEIDVMNGHGGFFKTPGTAERIMSAALDVPITVYESASEGGAWGIAILASFMMNGSLYSLPDFLNQFFVDSKVKTAEAGQDEKEGFQKFLKRYHDGLPIERAAVDNLK